MTNRLSGPRHSHSATLLPNGSVLVTGGSDGTRVLATTESYDPAQGQWTATPAMVGAHDNATVTLLPSGKVLVAGGASPTTELFNPSTGTWTATGNLNQARQYHSATLLPGGEVLAAGGAGLSTAELYRPDTGAWTPTGSLNTARYFHTATLLRNGKVLAAAGARPGALNSAELFDPTTRTWSTTGELITGRFHHTATLLQDGRVLLAGGSTANTELYDPALGRFVATTPMRSYRAYHTSTLLPNGLVLIAGGLTTVSLSACELYNPATGRWRATGALTQARDGHSAALLPNGKVLVAGGVYVPPGGTVLNLRSAEVYDPATGTWTLTAPLHVARDSDTAILLLNQKVLVAGGSGEFLTYPAPELYDVGLGSTAAWSPRVNPVNSPLNLGFALRITGSQFRGVSGASGGNSQDSSTDYPLLQLRAFESGWTKFVTCSNWSLTGFTSMPVLNFPPGWASATICVNGIQSSGAAFNVSVPAATPFVITGATVLADFRLSFTNTTGALFSVLAADNSPTNWVRLGAPAETSPGCFDFTDPLYRGRPNRLYQIRSQ